MNFNADSAKGRFTFDTIYRDEGLEDQVPRGMWLEVRGEVDDSTTIQVAIDTLGNIAIGFLPLIATAANAAIGVAEVAQALDVTPGKTEHDFFQNFVPHEITTRLDPGRKVDAAATLELAKAVERSSDKGRLLRALVQYRETLNYWRDGAETLAVSHLWMAVEALTRVALRKALSQEGSDSPDDLCEIWGIPKTDLDSEIRRRYIFHGNRRLCTRTGRASDGWEHGYMDLGDIRAKAKEVRDDAARHVRSAILELSETDPTAIATLTEAPFDTPLRLVPITKYVYGKFIGEVDSLAPEGQEYPSLLWTSSLRKFEAADDGKHVVAFNDSMKVQAGDGVLFQGERYEIWGPEPIQDESGSQVKPTSNED